MSAKAQPQEQKHAGAGGFQEARARSADRRRQERNALEAGDASARTHRLDARAPGHFRPPGGEGTPASTHKTKEGQGVERENNQGITGTLLLVRRGRFDESRV